MKKIVALALTLMLVLSLATVAFAAAPETYFATKRVFTAYDGQPAARYCIAANGENYKVELIADKEGDKDDNTVDTYKVKVTNLKSKNDVDLLGTYVEATSDDYEFVFVDGKEITYLSEYYFAKYSDEATKLTSYKASDYKKADCGDYISEYALYDYKGSVMRAVTSDFELLGQELIGRVVANADGKIVSLVSATKGTWNSETHKVVGGDYAVLEHAYKAEYKSFRDSDSEKTVVEVTKVYCDDCDKSFDFVVGGKTDAIKAFGAGNYENIGNLDIADLKNDNIYIKTGAASAASSSSSSSSSSNKNVSSAKTFDAGIALYVATALMGATGSAVVIGKKKEF